MVVVVLLLWCGVGGVIGWAIGNSKGRGALGFWLGFLLGVIGWIIIAFSTPSDEVLAQQTATATVLQAQVGQIEAQRTLRPCPFCAEMIQPAAVVCRYCGRDVSVAYMACGSDCQTCRCHWQAQLPSAANASHRAHDLERVANNEAPAIERTAMLCSMFRQEFRKALRHACIVEMHFARCRRAMSAVRRSWTRS